VPALSGQIITTITDGTGAAIVQVSWFFDPTTLVLRNNPIAWTDASGTVWPIGTGAIIGANLLNKAVRMVIRDSGGTVVRRVRLPAGTGGSYTKTQLANAAPPDGPYTVSTDLNGLTFDLSGAQLA
jgi:hypothetical protein